MTARDPRLASHSLRDDERPSPRRPITMPRELWAQIDAARGEQSCAEWLRAAALAKLEAEEGAASPSPGVCTECGAIQERGHFAGCGAGGKAAR